MKKIFTFSLIIGLILMTFSPFTVNAQDVLQDEEGNRATSGVYSEWSSTPYNMNNYNCYGYAIGTFQNINPGYYSYASAHFKYVGQSYGYVAFQPTIPINKIEAEIMQYNDSVN